MEFSCKAKQRRGNFNQKDEMGKREIGQAYGLFWVMSCGECELNTTRQRMKTSRNSHMEKEIL